MTTKISVFSKKGLEKINSVEIFDTEQYVILKNMSNELQSAFETKQIHRTDTEMRYSVLDDIKFPTLQGKYWQSVKEQDVFFKNLIYLSCDYEETQGELELLQIDLDEIKHDVRSNANKKIKRAQIQKTQFRLMEMRLEANDRLREIILWSIIKKELVALAIKEKNPINVLDCNVGQLETLQKKWENWELLARQTGDPKLFKAGISGLQSIEKSQVKIE